MSHEPSTRKGEFRSDLAQLPLPEVLVTLLRHKVPGVIECKRGDDEKKIFIDDGNIIFATSNSVADSLGDRLLVQGKITLEQYRESVRRLVREGSKRQGAILVEMRAIEPKELFVAVREQVEAIVWSIFEWESGTVIFTPGRDRHTEFIKLTLPTAQAIVEGVQRLPDAKRLVARIGSKATLLERDPSGSGTEVNLGEAGTAIFQNVDGKKTLFDLVSLPHGSPAEIAKMLYAMFALRLIRVKPLKQIKVKVKTGR